MPARPSRRVRWTALVLILVASVLASCSRGGPTASTTTLTGPKPTGLMDANLVTPLTRALKAHDRAGFLAHATGAAKSAMANWWDNLDAIGFDTGGASALDIAAATAPLDGTGHTSVTLKVGVHSPLDPTYLDKENPKAQPRPYVPSTRYDIGITVTTIDGPATITSWKPHDIVAPWDGPRLYVRKEGNVVLAGPQADKARIDASIADAQAAASWTLDYFKHVFSPIVFQTGFVGFLATDPATFDQWFVKPAYLKGWFADRAGTSFPLPGYDGNDPVLYPLPVGGARVTVPGDQSGATLRATLVHEFTHSLFAPDALWFSADGKTMPAWVAEGTASLVEATYRANNPNAFYDTSPIKAKIRQCVGEGLFHDGPPSDAELQEGTAEQTECAYDISAGLLASLGRAVDANNVFHSIRLAYTSNTVPWGYVVRSNTGGTLTYFDADSMERAALADFHTFYGV